METAGTTDTFETLMAKERERLTKKREDIAARQQKLDDELAAVDRELDAIQAYEDVKAGKVSTKRRPSSGARGEKRKKVLECVTGKGNGLTRAEIIEELGAKGNKAAEQSSAMRLRL